MRARAGRRVFGMPWVTRLGCLSFLSLLASSGLAEGPALPLIDDDEEFEEHLVVEAPRVRTPWVDYTRDHDNLVWHFELVVDGSGAVTSATFKDGPRGYRDEARRAALAARFEPFARDGVPARVRVEMGVYSRPSDYSGPADREFPENADPASIVIALSRSGCFGTCPMYRVELRGDGEVSYEAEQHVLVPGRHRWRIDPAKITSLLELFRRADYFKLDGFYEYPVSDLPTFVTRLSIGGRDKFVLDYGGHFVSSEPSIPRDGGGPHIPAIVMEIEDAIDEVAGTKSFVAGDGNTIARLRETRWNFRSRAAGNGLRMLLSDCKVDIARSFIEAGAPLDVVGEGFDAGLPITYAARCADVELARLMISRGALKKAKDAESFLWSSAASGTPAMVELALKHHGNARIPSEDGTPLLHVVAGSYVNEDDANAKVFDPVKVIDLLVAAGADPDERDDEGRTALFEASEPEVVNALLRHGADPTARDNDGETPLFGEFFAEAKAALIAAGTDVNARSKHGHTALFEAGGPVARLLLKAGADPHIANHQGSTAIERMNSEDAVLALLEAGARLPTDPGRLDAMIARARKQSWEKVLPLLTAPSN